MTPEEAAGVKFDPFDVTKIWPRSELCLISRLERIRVFF